MMITIDWARVMKSFRDVVTITVADFPAKVRSFVTNVSLLIVLFAVVVIFFRQLTNSAILLEPIKVPSSLAATGYTPEVTAQWIMDEMLDIQRRATETTRKDSQLIAPQWQQFDMEVPGAGVTLSSLGRALRESLGIAERRIRGEIVTLNAGYQLRLRQSGKREFRHVRFTDERDFNEIIQAAAEHAVQLLDPYIYATYLYETGNFDELESAIDYCLEHEPADDDKWAYNLRGSLRDEAGEPQAAIENYARAAANGNFAPALVNWANVLHKEQRHEEALDKLLQAFALDPDLYDATKEATFRVLAGRTIGRDPDRRSDALDQYRLAHARNPQDSEALFWWGIALMRQSTPDNAAAAEKFSEVERIRGDSTSSQIYEQWARALEGTGDYGGAIAKYEAAIARDREGYGHLRRDIDNLKSRQSGL